MNNELPDQLGADMTRCAQAIAPKLWTEGLTLTGRNAKRFEIALRVASSAEVHFHILEAARGHFRATGKAYEAACLDSLLGLTRDFARTFPPQERVA